MKTVSQPLTSDGSELSWWRKFDLSKYKVPLSIASFCIGWIVLGGCWFHTIRSVKHIVLRKGGNSVTIATPTPFGRTRYITRPLQQLTATSSRMERSYMALKVQGKPFHFLVDTRGNFVRPELFDRTVGVRREFSSQK
ncbi:hypothetical protein FHG87_022739 [Trinorchestia longiramus]|nr:hypothetical protein FHG87_022739 [Trinorchestia longiramus]